MIKLIVLAMLFCLSVTNVLGAAITLQPGAPDKKVSPPTTETKSIGAERVQLPATQGVVSFPHRKHQNMLKDCTTCHACKTGKIPELSKDWAHNTCRGCHGETSNAPIQCKGCHLAGVPSK